MKHKTIAQFVLGFILILSTVIVISCSEKETTQLSQSIETTSNFEASIQHFMTHWLQPYKTSSQMQIDAALDSLELALNYNYGDATFQFSEFIMDTSLVQCQQLYDSISNYDLLAAYNKCVDSLGAQYDRVDASSKQMVWAMVKLDTIIGTTVNIYVIGGFGNGAYLFPRFQQGDDWVYGCDLGKCDGTQVGLDAADALMEKVNYRKPPILNGPAIITNFINSSEFWPGDIDPWNFPNPNDPDPNDGLFDCLLFVDYSDVEYCLEYGDMNFYLDGLETIIYNSDPNGIKPIGYSFINVEMEGDLMLTPTSSEKRHWITNAVYGEIVYVNHSPDAL